jgi:methylase of polypeptide subunit release factors
MSQRDSGYERKERDCYETPEWVTEALLPHIPDRVRTIWEPACGSGKMVPALSQRCETTGTDIESGHDFLSMTAEPWDAIITNPPYSLAKEFIERRRLRPRTRPKIAI